jgi:hypothetical protein
MKFLINISIGKIHNTEIISEIEDEIKRLQTDAG